MMKYLGYIFLLVYLSLESCQMKVSSNAQLKQYADEQLINIGDSIVQASFATLSSNLRRAMAAGGLPNAVSFCNIAAMPLTDSLSTEYGATIKRTSDKVRNMLNAPTEIEREVIAEYQVKHERKQLLTPIVKDVDGMKTYYAPILVNEMCLNCHGDRSQIKDYQMIADLYPEDRATGYKLGDLRGIWSVSLRH
jgi:hypothetical protein